MLPLKSAATNHTQVCSWVALRGGEPPPPRNAQPIFVFFRLSANKPFFVKIYDIIWSSLATLVTIYISIDTEINKRTVNHAFSSVLSAITLITAPERVT